MLITVKEIKEKYPQHFRSISSVHSFIKIRKIPKDSILVKSKMSESNESLYKLSLIEYWLEVRPIAKRKTPKPTPKNTPRPKPKKNTDAPISGKPQPFRAYDCYLYSACLSEAAFKNTRLKCQKCRSYKKEESSYYEAKN